jgi:hypothetical protein
MRRQNKTQKKKNCRKNLAKKQLFFFFFSVSFSFATEMSAVPLVQILRTVIDALEEVPSHHRVPRVELSTAQPSISCAELLAMCSNVLVGDVSGEVNPLIHPGALAWSRAATPSIPAASAHTRGASMVPPPRLVSTARGSLRGGAGAGASLSSLQQQQQQQSQQMSGLSTSLQIPQPPSARARAQTAPSGGSRRHTGTRGATAGRSGGGHRRGGFKGTSVLENAATRAKEDARIRLETFRATRMEKARAEGNGDLLRSLRVLDDHERDKALMSSRRSSEREQHFRGELDRLDEAFAAARDRLNDEWDGKAADLDAELDDVDTRVAVSHEAEERGLEITLTERPAPRPRFSTKLLDLRRTQELQARAGLAELSIATKEHANQLEAEETRAHEAALAQATERQRRTMRERHDRENKQVACRATDRRVRFQRDCQAALAVLQQKFANHKRDIEHARILESHRKPRPTEGKVPLTARGSAAATARASALLAREG